MSSVVTFLVLWCISIVAIPIIDYDEYLADSATNSSNKLETSNVCAPEQSK